MLRVDQQAITSGEGLIYGQLMVLGHAEYRQVDKKWLPFGLANQKFVLKRRYAKFIALSINSYNLIFTL